MKRHRQKYSCGRQVVALCVQWIRTTGIKYGFKKTRCFVCVYCKRLWSDWNSVIFMKLNFSVFFGNTDCVDSRRCRWAPSVDYFHAFRNVTATATWCCRRSRYVCGRICNRRIGHVVAAFSPASLCEGPGSWPGQSVLDLWRAKWHWDRVFLQAFRLFPVSIIP